MVLKIFTGTAAEWEQMEKHLAEEKGLIEPSGLKVWDTIFGGFHKASLYMVAACRGTGKTSFLIAMAKYLSKSKRVLYITIEQRIEDVVMYFKGTNVHIAEIQALKDWDEITPLCSEYDYICYDYLGALSEFGEDNNLSEWQSLRENAKYLANVAKIFNITVITAAQADDALENDYHEHDNLNDVKRNGSYISFSKHMSDLISGGAYLLRDGSLCYLIEFKNRYHERHINAEKINLNYSSKSFDEYLI